MKGRILNAINKCLYVLVCTLMSRGILGNMRETEITFFFLNIETEEIGKDIESNCFSVFTCPTVVWKMHFMKKDYVLPRPPRILNIWSLVS